MTTDELRTIAAQLRRTAQLIAGKPACDHPRRCQLNAEHALLITKDWTVPLTAASGPGPKNQPGDPTGNAALRPPDQLAKEHAALTKELRAAYAVCADLGSRILGNTVPARIENERAGIGRCKGEGCGRYCDGASSHTRLRNGMCSACDQRLRRALRTKVTA